MTRPTRSFPPPEDAAARYDAVLRRGHSLRRRQRLVRGAGAGGAALALLLIAVLLSTGGKSNDQVVVDRPDQSTTSSTASSTTTAPPATMAVTVMADPRAVAVRVSDPAGPDSPDARICAQVRLVPAGPASVATAEGNACWNRAADGNGDTEADLRPTNGAEVGCAVTQTREDPAATTAPTTAPSTRSVRHDFTFSVPPDLPAGKYVAEVVGVSGVGDGCPPSGDGETESVADGKATLRLP